MSFLRSIIFVLIISVVLAAFQPILLERSVPFARAVTGTMQEVETSQECATDRYYRGDHRNWPALNPTPMDNYENMEYWRDTLTNGSTDFQRYLEAMRAYFSNNLGMMTPTTMTVGVTTSNDNESASAQLDLEGPPGNIHKDDTVLWRITFNVICGELVANKEIAFWQYRGTGIRLIHREIQRLDCEEKGDVQIESNRIVLTGDGYIECKEPEGGSLSEVVSYLSDSKINFCDDPKPGSTECKKFEGENVVVYAEVKLSSVQTSTILDYSPRDGKNDNDDRNLTLRIEESAVDNAHNVSFSLPNKEPFSSSWYITDDQWHLLRVEQEPYSIDSSPDEGQWTKTTWGDKFTYLVDGFHLTEKEFLAEHDIRPTHFFVSDHPQTLTIGKGFVGEIRSAIIDPSDTCLSCFPVPILD